ncbi:hypothetical protein [Teredinibacter purpureus]|uniref:hypothetical protein n=1 Tax=Teredinibacter purpureus TaxID=2731756 RepID=UPI0005F7A774|nr:hypothetical protein [Teredinibacter purpureus]
MNIQQFLLRTGIAILLGTPHYLSASEELKTDWLKATTGSSGETLGSEVINVKQEGDITTVEVDIDVDNLEDYETVVVIGKKSNKPVELTKEPELLSNDDEVYGIRFQIKRLPGFEFRLRMADDSEQILK